VAERQPAIADRGPIFALLGANAVSQVGNNITAVGDQAAVGDLGTMDTHQGVDPHPKHPGDGASLPAHHLELAVKRGVVVPGAPVQALVDPAAVLRSEAGANAGGQPPAQPAGPRRPFGGTQPAVLGLGGRAGAAMRGAWPGRAIRPGRPIGLGRGWRWWWGGGVGAGPGVGVAGRAIDQPADLLGGQRPHRQPRTLIDPCQPGPLSTRRRGGEARARSSGWVSEGGLEPPRPIRALGPQHPGIPSIGCRCVSLVALSCP
jgi:hypothetical protein